MGKDRANKGTQQTEMDQYTAQNAGASLQRDPPATSEKGAEPTIETSSRATQTQIAVIAVDVNLMRADLKVVAERSVSTEQKVTCMQPDVDILKASVATLEAQIRKLEARVKDAEAKLKVLHGGRAHFFQSTEAVWDSLEWSDGTVLPESPQGVSSGRPRGPEEVRTAVRRSTRRHCAGYGSRVIVRSDGTLSLERKRQEREEAKLLVQTVASEASLRSGSPCVASGLSTEGEAEVT
ncbi:hypothetical protein NDU88_006647 [Pleurodeles waltl]|uniref:Uncharacterized protein n=1 Tax=Pleurodeles waltl TaxID=8319 RepID=A0AAV7NRB8_PLEWA|nr:hypothetical protein NDU88_006647 [Pleurodeles waltl]